MAIEIMWECLVRCGRDAHSLDFIELKLPQEPEPVTDPNEAELQELPPGDYITSLPLDHLLPRFSDALGSPTLPTESLSQTGSLVEYLRGPRTQVARPDRKPSVPPSRDAGRSPFRTMSISSRLYTS